MNCELKIVNEKLTKGEVMKIPILDKYYNYRHYRSAMIFKKLSKFEQLKWLLQGKMSSIEITIIINDHFVDCWIPAFRSMPFTLQGEDYYKTPDEAHKAGEKIRILFKLQLAKNAVKCNC